VQTRLTLQVSATATDEAAAATAALAVVALVVCQRKWQLEKLKEWQKPSETL
jgi:hypothetical protein